MGESSASYMRMMQSLVETCLTFHMTKEECMETLSKHANINPVITSTVWKELEKENKEFFEAYYTKAREDCMTKEEITPKFQDILSDFSSTSTPPSDKDKHHH